MKIEKIIGIIAAGIGAWFLFRPKQAVANVPDEWHPPLLAPLDTSTYLDPLEEMFMPRGIRNHNPMNLRWYSPINWDGQIGPDNEGYARFEDVYFGIRAGVKNLVNGYFHKGIASPEAIITKYAPSHENPTDNYIQFVADKMGIDKTATIPMTQTNMERLTKAIIHFENGSQPYTDATIRRGVIAGMTT